MNKSSSKSDEISTGLEITNSEESGSTWDISSIQDSSNNQDSKIMLNNIDFSKFKLNNDSINQYRLKSFENFFKQFQQSIIFFEKLSSFFFNPDETSIDSFHKALFKLLRDSFNFRGSLENKNEKLKYLSEVCGNYSHILKYIEDQLKYSRDIHYWLNYFTQMRTRRQSMLNKRDISLSCYNQFVIKSKILNESAFLQRFNVELVKIINEERNQLEKETRELKENMKVLKKSYADFNRDFNKNFDSHGFSRFVKFLESIEKFSRSFYQDCIDELLQNHFNNKIKINEREFELNLFYKESNDKYANNVNSIFNISIANDRALIHLDSIQKSFNEKY